MTAKKRRLRSAPRAKKVSQRLPLRLLIESVEVHARRRAAPTRGARSARPRPGPPSWRRDPESSPARRRAGAATRGPRGGWIARNRGSAIALARTSFGTERRTTVLIGAVDAKIAVSHANASTKNAVALGAQKHAAARGAARTLDHAHTRRPIRHTAPVVARRVRAPDPAIGEHAAHPRAERARHDEDPAEGGPRLRERQPIDRVNEFRRPEPEAADRGTSGRCTRGRRADRGEWRRGALSSRSSFGREGRGSRARRVVARSGEGERRESCWRRFRLRSSISRARIHRRDQSRPADDPERFSPSRTWRAARR